MHSDILFKPWKGGSYDSSASILNKKTLVLGGSHYIEGEFDIKEPSTRKELAEFTREVVGYYLDPNCADTWKKTYSTFINSVYGHDTSPDERKAFFDSVVFYNYLQEAAGEDAYSAHEYDYNAPQHFNAFLQVIREHRPEVIIAWGSHVWNALPNNWGYGEANKDTEIVIDGKPFNQCYEYPFEDSTITLVGAHHPSAGYDSEWHYKVFSKLNSLFLL